jgi:hypothetical protein
VKINHISVERENIHFIPTDQHLQTKRLYSSVLTHKTQIIMEINPRSNSIASKK